jgi:L-cysteine desulfhydrase
MLEEEEVLECGARLRQDQFPHHYPSLTRLNNGSFGACPKVVLEHQNMIRSKWLGNPDDVWYTFRDEFESVSLSIARQLFVDESLSENIFPVDNLTVAFALIANSVIASISDPNAVIIVSNLTYNAVQKAATYYADLASSRFSSGERVSFATVNIPFPLLDGDAADEIILSAYKTCLEEVAKTGKRPVLAIVDHISSLPCMVMPVRQIVALCREFGVEEVCA